MAEFEAVEFSTGFEDAVGFGKGFIDVGDVAEAEGDGVDIKMVVGEGEVFGVSGDPFEVVDPAFVEGAVATYL